MRFVDCKGYAAEILNEVREVPSKKELWILSLEPTVASRSYMKGKIKDCESCWVPHKYIEADSSDLLRQAILDGNKSSACGGIIVQLPLPDSVDESEYTGLVCVEKDVDGFIEESKFPPCTPEGIVHVLVRELGRLRGKSALVIGRGRLVGKPVAEMLCALGCGVTVAHSGTTNLDELLGQHDIIISAVGKAGLVDLKKCKAELVVDVGVNRGEDGKLCGDCFNFDADDGSDMRVTPVPGGVGLLTRAMLMRHMIPGMYDDWGVDVD